MVVELLKRLPNEDVEPALLTIYDPAPGTGAAFPFRLFSAGRRDRKDRLFMGRLVREIRRYKPDIVHTHTHVGRYWGRAAALFASVSRVVHTEHNPCDVRRTPAERAADWTLHRATSRFVTFFGEQRLSFTKFENLPLEKVVVIPNGLAWPPEPGDRTEARAQLGLLDDEFAIMLIGRMEYQKNHDLALQALAALNRSARDTAVLFFAGSGVEEAALAQAARDLGLEGRVRFLGYRSDVRELLPGVDLLLMTSWFEGMPLALLEAMFAGVPIVTTPWCGARDMLGEGRFGFISAGYEPRAIASRIELAYARPETRRRVANRAEQHARTAYTIELMVERHRHLYLELVEAAS
jgi:glycosyltransferase involved in cell wall biosynthesis